MQLSCSTEEDSAIIRLNSVEVPLGSVTLPVNHEITKVLQI